MSAFLRHIWGLHGVRREVSFGCLAERSLGLCRGYRLNTSDIRPTMGSRETLGFLGARSPLDGNLLLINDLLEPVPIGSVSASLFLTACSLITTLLFASSISKKEDGWVGDKHKLFKQKGTKDLRCQVRSSYLIAAWVGSGLSQYQWTLLRLTSLAQVRSSSLNLAKILSRKLNSSNLWALSD